MSKHSRESIYRRRSSYREVALPAVVGFTNAGGGAVTRRSRLLRRVARRKTRIGILMISILLCVIGLNIVSIYASDLFPSAIQGQTDLSGSMNAAAVFAAVAGFTVSGVAALRGLECRDGDRLAWFVIGSGCLGFALIDLLLDGRGGDWIALPMGLVAGVLFLTIYRQVRSSRGAVVLLLLALLLAAMNPVLDAVEREIIGEPDNYRFVIVDNTYELTSSAWRSLDLVRQLQEGTELLVITALFGVFLTDVDESELPE